MKKYILLTFILTSALTGVAYAQDNDVEELNLIELELDRSATPVKEESTVTTPSQETTTTRVNNEEEKHRDVNEDDIRRLSDFRQVSVIQKRYLPRTGRFQFYIAPAMTLNDPWYNVMGGSLRLGYNFTESLGIEGGYTFLGTDKSQAHKELKKEHNITTNGLVYTKSNYTIDLNWTPFYGKMTWLNEQILYYDNYFSIGFGGTEIQDGKSQSTIHLGAGQIFSITKAYAFRWDVTWNTFEAKQVDKSAGTVNNIIISAGLSFFFPEASYR